MTDRGGVTDYFGKLYAGRLDGPTMRHHIQVATECCGLFGTLACLDCPLADFLPEAVPDCGMDSCAGCPTRPECPCGNERLRAKLSEKIGLRFTLTDRGPAF
jgi:hypothetical protein